MKLEIYEIQPAPITLDLKINDQERIQHQDKESLTFLCEFEGTIRGAMKHARRIGRTGYSYRIMYFKGQVAVIDKIRKSESDRQELLAFKI